MLTDFTKTMEEATNEDLIRIVTIDRDNYQEAAVMAAETELAKRKLSAEKIDAARTYNEKHLQIRTFKASVPLDLHWKVLTFMFPGLLQIILSGIFRGDGYERKANELVKWTLRGFGFYIGLAALISML